MTAKKKSATHRKRHNQRRRDAKRGGDLTLNGVSIGQKIVMSVQGRRCVYCYRDFPRRGADKFGRYATWDHVIPLVLGGRHAWNNRILACDWCNKHKGGNPPNGCHLIALDWVTTRLVDLVSLEVRRLEGNVRIKPLSKKVRPPRESKPPKPRLDPDAAELRRLRDRQLLESMLTGRSPADLVARSR